MKKVILDTSFILTSVKQKIDFIEDLYLKGYKIIIPEQVIVEINGLSKKNISAKIALDLIEKNNLEKIDLKSKNTDKAIIDYVNKNNDLIVATLDKEIIKNSNCPKIIIKEKKRLELK